MFTLRLRRICFQGAIFATAVLAPCASLSALEHLLVRRDGEEFQLSGRVEVVAQDGGLMLIARDGVIWRLQPDELVERRADERQFTPLSPEELAEATLAELPDGFRIYKTANYVVCYNTTRAYAQWTSSLLERLYKAFTNYWTRSGFELTEPEFPLLAVVFADREQYRRFSADELGDRASSIIGYYSLRTNRVTMVDLTGTQAARGGRGSRGSPAEINRLLARPDAERTVATIIHEATHQIAYNCGLHTRYADIPLWVSEGIAVYFETPDLASRKGWRTIGAVNQPRFAQFRRYYRHRPADSLETLIADDQRMRDAKRAADAYAEAWALNYFLLQKHREAYQSYLKRLAEKRPFFWDDPETRLREFREAFGSDLKEFDEEFLRSMSKLR